MVPGPCDPAQYAEPAMCAAVFVAAVIGSRVSAGGQGRIASDSLCLSAENVLVSATMRVGRQYPNARRLFNIHRKLPVGLYGLRVESSVAHYSPLRPALCRRI